jgi:WD40 repeat protein
MATANPEKLELVKQHNLDRLIAMAMVRESNTGRLFLGGSTFKVYVTDPNAAKLELKEIGGHESYVTGIALAGKAVVSGGYDGKLIWWDADQKKQVRSVDAHSKWIRSVTATRDGKYVASTADDMVCKVWEGASGKLVHELRGHAARTPTHFPSMLFASAFSPDGKHLATADKVGHVVVWDVASGKQVATLEAPTLYTWDSRQRIHSIGGIRGLAFSPDGKSIAVGGIGQIGNIDHLDGPARVEVFDWHSGKRTHEIAKTKFKALVNKLVYHPQGEWLAAAGGAGDGMLFFVDLKNNKVVKEEKVKMHVHAVALNDNADTLYLAGHGSLVCYEMKG